MRLRMPRLIKDIVERYSEEIIMPKLDEEVRAIIEKHEVIQEELKMKNSKPEEPARAEPPLPQTVQDHAAPQSSLQAIPSTTSPSKESETVSFNLRFYVLFTYFLFVIVSLNRQDY